MDQNILQLCVDIRHMIYLYGIKKYPSLTYVSMGKISNKQVVIQQGRISIYPESKIFYRKKH